MAGSPDSSNLMYVTKAYEEEVKNKAKRIYSNDEVALTLENINKQLNDIVKEINEKLTFVTDKIDGEYGVDAYVRGVHTQIDRVDINQEDLVPDDIKNTRSHPSVMAFKSNRSETKYNTYDFINKSIELDNKTPNLAISGSKTIDPNENMLSFEFNTTTEEYLKIIEFSFTYKQYPDVIVFDVDKNIKREPTVSVTRIISGRFFLIRHDPVNHPDEFIIKAIVVNSDNTGNIIDKKLIDVQSYKDTGDVSYIFDNGPQFDLYFTFNDTNSYRGLQVHIGKIVPYRYVMRKNYIDTNDGTIDTNFNRIETTIGATDAVGSHDIEDIYHSNNLSCSFIVDKTKNEISILSDGNSFDSRVLVSDENIKHKSGSPIQEMWSKDIGYYTFIRLKDNEYDTTFVGINNVNHLVDLGKGIDDIIALSTDEIIVKIGNSYHYFDTSNNIILDQQVYIIINNDISFSQKSMIYEMDSKYLILIYTKKDGIYYRIKEIDVETNKYSTNFSISPEHNFKEFPVEKVAAIDPVDCELFGQIDNTGLYIGVNYINNQNSYSFIIYANDLVVSGISYLFTNNNLLSVYNKNDSSTSDLKHKIKKMINTRLFDFLILDNNELFIYDEKRIVKAITFEESVESPGFWTDKNSVLYMKPETNQSEYYLVDNSYLQNVFDVVDSPNGVLIIDKEGVYTVQETKNIVCNLFFENNSELIKYLPSFDKYGRSGAIISIEDKTSQIHKYNVFKNDYLLKERSGDRLRYEYLDLFTSDYQLYEEGKRDYDSELPVIDFNGILYVSFVDHLSVLYNVAGNNDIIVNETLPYSTLTNPDIKTQKYCLTTNKYGFIKYDNILKLDSSESRISDINAIKSLKIIHNSNDSFTYKDAIDTIHEIIKKEYEKIKDDWATINKPRIMYKTETDEYEPFKHITVESIGQDQTVLHRPIDTKYGRYGLVKGVDKYVLGWQSDSVLMRDIITFDDQSDDKSKKLPLINCDFTLDGVFKIIPLDDNIGTTFISNGSYVYKTVARDENGVFTLPFSDTQKVSICQAESENLTNIVKTKDGEVLAWISVKGKQSVYKYDSVTQNFVVFDKLTNILADVVVDVNTIKIINLIKINNNYHIIALNEEATDIYHFKYIIRGEKQLLIDTHDSIIPKTAPLDGTETSDIEIYDFTDCILAVTKNNKENYICKYDKSLDQFVPIIYPLSYTNNTDGKLRIIEVKNKDGYDIYGSFENNEVSKENYYPLMFKLDINNEYIETLIPHIYHIVNDVDFYYDSYRKYVVLYITHDTSNSNIFRYFPSGDEIESLVKTSIFDDTNGPYLISDPYKIVTKVGLEENIYYKQYSLAEHEVDGSKNLYLAELKENTSPKEMYKIGLTGNKFTDIITMPRITGDTYPIKYGMDFKPYYKIDPSKTLFNLFSASAQSYPSGTNTNLVKIFKRIVKNTYDKIRIDKSFITKPIRGFRYYKMTLNGTFEEQYDIKEFDKLSDYYIDDAIYELITPEDYNKDGNMFDPTWTDIKNQHNILLFTCVDPKFIKCVESDFLPNPDPDDALINPYVFKDKLDVVYYELDKLQYSCTFDKSNFRFMDDKIFINVSASGVGKDVYTPVNTDEVTAPSPDEVYYEISGDAYVEVTNTEDQPFEAWSEGVTYYTHSLVYDNSIGNKSYNEHELAYTYEDISLFTKKENSNKIIEHLLPVTYDKVITTKFCKLGIETRAYATGKRVLSIERISDDLLSIEEEYFAYEIDQDKNEPLIEINETSKYIFVTLRDTEKNVYNTFIIDGETLVWTETDVANKKDYHYITEFENGNIYGISLDTSVDNTLHIYKHGVNGTSAFGEALSIDVGGAKILNAFVHKTYDKRTELFIFCLGTKYKVYRLYDDSISVYDDDALQYIISNNNIIILNDKFIDYQNNKIYDFVTKTLTDFSDRFEVTDYDNVKARVVTDDLYTGINKQELILESPDEEKSYIFDFTTIAYDPFKLYEDDKNILVSDKAILEINGNQLVMMKQLPIVTNDNELYYTSSKAKKNNLLPTYEDKYDIYDPVTKSIKVKNCNFDRLFNTSVGIFGINKLNICLNKIYSDNNGFILVYTLEEWIGNPQITPIIQECDGEIYLCYKNVYKFNRETENFESILSFDKDSRVNIKTINSIDEYEIVDKYFSKLFITESNDMYYFMDVEDVHNVYKYNKATKIMELHYEISDYMTAIRDTTIGVIILTNDNSIYNITRKEKLDNPKLADHIITKLDDFVEIHNNNYKLLYLTATADDDKTYGFSYNYDNKTWVSASRVNNTGHQNVDIASKVNFNKLISRTFIDNDGDPYELIIHCIFDKDEMCYKIEPQEFNGKTVLRLYYAGHFYKEEDFINSEGTVNFVTNYIDVGNDYETIMNTKLHPIKTNDNSIEVELTVTISDAQSTIYTNRSIVEFKSKKMDKNELHIRANVKKTIDILPYRDILAVMKYNGIYIYKTKDSVRLDGFNIVEDNEEPINETIKQLGYTYSLIGANTKKWNNEQEDVSNTLKDKYLVKVFGIYKGDEFNELYIDDNNEYESDVELFKMKRMSLVEFYKKYYVTNWETRKHNHIFKRMNDVVNNTYISSYNPLDLTEDGNSIFDNEKFEIELNIFGSPIETSEENKIEELRISNSWYLKKLNRHVPHLPYYPFEDA